MRGISKGVLDRPSARYAMTVLVVAASFLLRWALVQGFGLEMPTFITFYPGVMLVAVLTGFWPGVFATALVVLGTDYLILSPVGSFSVVRISDAVALALFAAMGILMSFLAEHYRRGQRLITAYKVEQELWVSKEKLELAMASMADAVLITDTRDRILDFNDPFVAFHRFPNRAECSRDLADYARLFEVFLPDGTPVPVEDWTVSRALRGETATNAEYRLRRTDTGETWFGSYSFNPLRESDGSIIGAVVVARDITESKRAEEARAADRAKLELAMASMSDAVFISDTGGRFIQFNDAFARFCRFKSKMECSGTLSELREHLEIFTPDGEPVPPEMRPVPRSLRGETGASLEFKLRRKETGETWWASYNFAPLRDSKNEIVGSVVVARDITEKKHIEDKLRESEASLASAQARAHLGSWEVDLATWEGKFSAEMMRLYYLEPSNPVPDFDGFLELIHPEDRGIVEDQQDHIAEIYDPLKFELRTNPSIGPMRHLGITFGVIRDSAGSPVRLVGTSLDITESKRAEEALRASESLYRGLFDSMDEGFCIIEMIFDPEGKPADYRFLEINAAFERQAGLHDAAGKRMRELAPTIEEHWFEIYGKVALTGEPAHFCNESKALGRYFEASAYRAGEPGLRHVAVVFSDITSRVQADQHIRQLNRALSVLSDINQTIVRVKDTQAMLEAACRIAVEKGKFRMAWIGMIDPATQAVKPVAFSGATEGYLDRLRIILDDPSTTRGPAAQSILSGTHAICNDIEHDPHYLPWREAALARGYRSSAGFPLKVDGEVVGLINLYAGETGFFVGDELAVLDELAMDVSFALEVNRREEERRNVEEELLRRTALFEAQVDSAPDGILVVDGEGRKILQNQRLSDLMKIPREIAENPDDGPQRQFVTTIVKDPDRFTEKVNYLMSHPEEVSRDEVELTDGTILERYSSPVRDKVLHYYGRIWTFRDITERRKLEEQFRQAQKMDAVGQLTGGIAHDFNNLLTVIQGCAEFIGEEVNENPRLSKMAGMILGAAKRGAELTHRMLAFARRQSLQPRPVNVNHLLLDMESLLRRTLSAEIELDLARGGEDCEAMADPAQLESAVLNLCLNARDAMPGGGRLSIEVGKTVLDSDYTAENPDVQPGRYICLAVSDTGTGISPENLDRVFDPFFTTKEVGKGTGLGLSMVYGFAKQSRGHVKIYSEVGHGTSVKLYLPQANQSSHEVEESPDYSVELRGSEVILLAEDDADVREFAKTQLVYLGYRVLEAANGAEALTMLRDHAEVDLLFTDMVMPGGMNGNELAQVACRLRPALKVLYCSGYAESVLIHQGLTDRDVEFLNKPYTRLELAKRIRKVLTKQ